MKLIFTAFGRDIKDSTLGTLSQRILGQLEGVEGLTQKLTAIVDYLGMVTSDRIPVNNQIIFHLQDIYNLLPDLHLHDTMRSIHVNTNDQMLVIYVASIVRAILALHDLINNKLANRESERSEESSSTASAPTTAGGDPKKAAPAANGSAATQSGTGSASAASKEEKAKRDKPDDSETKSKQNNKPDETPSPGPSKKKPKK